MSEEMKSLRKNQTWELTNSQKGRRQLDANGCMQRKKDFLAKMMFATKQDW